MTQTPENIYYQFYTGLPTKLLMKADKANPVLEVITPHKGIVFIEIKTVSKSWLGIFSEADRPSQEVLTELHNLEEDAKRYLLNKWYKTTV